MTETPVSPSRRYGSLSASPVVTDVVRTAVSRCALPESPRRARIGTAGWRITRSVAAEFPAIGSHLTRYSTRLSGVEINSSFYREHAFATYERWRSEVTHFRFAVKMPRNITHVCRLQRSAALVRQFLHQIAGLGPALGPVLVQLPPSLTFQRSTADRFFGHLREHFRGAVVCEPRHSSWGTLTADRLLCRWQVGRVAADPPRIGLREAPGGWLGPTGDGRHATVYYRLHGSPRVYWSSYPEDVLTAQAAAIRAWPRSTDVWCIFDNTAAGAAIENAITLQSLLETHRSARLNGQSLARA